MRIVALVAVIAVASAACGAESPAAPTAQTTIDVRVGDLYNFKLGTPIPVPTVTGTLSGNFAASIGDGPRWLSLGNANAGDDPSVIRVIAVQLNSEQWLTRNVAESGQVEDDALLAAISASTSVESR